MGFLDKIKRKVETTLADSRQDEELIYEYITNEIEAGVIRKGLYSKALANSKGDETEANALYMKYRLRSIKDAMKGESFQDFVAQKERDFRISQQLALSEELEKKRIKADEEAAKKKLAEAKKKRKREAEEKARQEKIRVEEEAKAEEKKRIEEEARQEKIRIEEEAKAEEKKRIEEEAKAEEKKRIEEEAKAAIEKRETEVRARRELIRLKEEAEIKKVREEVMSAKEKLRREKKKEKAIAREAKSEINKTRRERELYENRLLDEKHNAIIREAVANRVINLEIEKKRLAAIDKINQEEKKELDAKEKIRLDKAETNRLNKLKENEKKRNIAINEIAQEKKKGLPKEKFAIEAKSVIQKNYSIDGITFKSKRDYEAYIEIHSQN